MAGRPWFVDAYREALEGQTFVVEDLSGVTGNYTIPLAVIGVLMDFLNRDQRRLLMLSLLRSSMSPEDAGKLMAKIVCARGSHYLEYPEDSRATLVDVLRELKGRGGRIAPGTNIDVMMTETDLPMVVAVISGEFGGGLVKSSTAEVLRDECDHCWDSATATRLRGLVDEALEREGTKESEAMAAAEGADDMTDK